VHRLGVYSGALPQFAEDWAEIPAMIVAVVVVEVVEVVVVAVTAGEFVRTRCPFPGSRKNYYYFAATSLSMSYWYDCIDCTE